MIYAFQARRLLFFSSEGKFLRDTPVWSTYGRLLEASLDSDGNILGKVPLMAGQNGFAIKKFSPDYSELFTVATIEREKIPILENLAKNLLWCVSGDGKIIWGNSGQYEISLINRDGELIKKVIKKHAPIRINEEEWKETINRKFGGRPIPPDFEQKLPDYYPAFKSILTDESGRLYISTYSKTQDGKGYYCDIFNVEGKYIAKLPFQNQPQLIRNIAWGQSAQLHGLAAPIHRKQTKSIVRSLHKI